MVVETSAGPRRLWTVRLSNDWGEGFAEAIGAVGDLAVLKRGIHAGTRHPGEVAPEVFHDSGQFPVEQFLGKGGIVVHAAQDIGADFCALHESEGDVFKRVFPGGEALAEAEIRIEEDAAGSQYACDFG